MEELEVKILKIDPNEQRVRLEQQKVEAEEQKTKMRQKVNVFDDEGPLIIEPTRRRGGGGGPGARRGGFSGSGCERDFEGGWASTPKDKANLQGEETLKSDTKEMEKAEEEKLEAKPNEEGLDDLLDFLRTPQKEMNPNIK